MWQVTHLLKACGQAVVSKYVFAWQAAVEALLMDDEELNLGVLDLLDAAIELRGLLDDVIMVLLACILLLACIALLAGLLEFILLLTRGVEAVLELGVLDLDALEMGVKLALLLALPPSIIGPPPHPNSVSSPLKTISRNT
jgi:hypothetical protein